MKTVLDKLKQKNVKMCVATATDKGLIERHLRETESEIILRLSSPARMWARERMSRLSSVRPGQLLGTAKEDTM